MIAFWSLTSDTGQSVTGLKLTAFLLLYQGEHLMLLLPESDLTDENFLVHVSEFLVSSSISHLFTEEEQTSVINAVRTEVTQAGLAYTRDVAWDFFLR